MGNTQQKQKYIKDIQTENYDIYKIFNINKNNYTWDELKINYKKLAIKTHPDKGGDKFIFDFITSKFKELAHILKMKDDNKNFNELKNNYNEYKDKNENNTNIESYNSKFNDNLTINERINKHFDSTKIYDDDIDFGYGDTMLKSSEERGELKIDNIFNGKVNNKTFNDKFNKTVVSSREIVKHIEPEALVLAKGLSYTEIGAGKNNDYSSSLDKSKNLAYTDYMKAHTTNRLVNIDEFDNIKKFKNTEEYKKYSDKNIKKKFTDKEIKQFDKLKSLEEKKELDRLERIKQNNIAITKSYELANRLMIN